MSSSANYKVRLKALKNTSYKFTKVPYVPNFFLMKCNGCENAGVSTKSNIEVKEGITTERMSQSAVVNRVPLQEASVPDYLSPNDTHSPSNLSSIPPKMNFQGLSSASSNSLPLAGNGQYRRLQSADLSADICHHLLVVLAHQNQV